MNEKIEVGDGRTLTATFSADGETSSVETDHVHLTIRRPDGSEETHNGSDLSEQGGVVSYDIVFDQPGTWFWAFEWDNTVDPPQAAETSQFVEVPRVSRQNSYE